jgi:aspartate/methionine/tyrosine aminotransferase
MNSPYSFRRHVDWNLGAQYLKWRGAPEGSIPMASGEHDFQPPDGLFKRTLAAFENRSSAYGPLEGLPEVRQEIARHQSSRHNLRISADHIQLVPTVSVGLALVANALLGQRANVVFLGSPVYYAIAAPVLSTGAECEIVDIFHPSWKTKLKASVNDKTAALYMANPHSPTGYMFSKADLMFVSELCEQHDVTMVSDDVYECMRLEKQYTPLYSISEYSKTRSIVFSSFAKCFNVCGVSASFCVCHPTLFLEICRFYGGPVFMCNVSSQLVIADCLANDWWIEELNARLIACRDHLFPHFRDHARIDVERPDSGMFLWCRPVDIKEPSAVAFFSTRLGIDVMDGGQFHGGSNDYCRLNFGTHPEILDEVKRRLECL